VPLFQVKRDRRGATVETRRSRRDADFASARRKEKRAMMYILLWLLGAPLTLILILFLLGIGR